MKTLAVILAGGSGSRFQSEQPKQFATLDGKPVLRHSADVFDASPLIDEILVVSHPDHADRIREITRDLKKTINVVCGGKTRSDSSVAAVRFAKEHGFDRILLHDAARPLIDVSLVSRLCAALDSGSEAAVAAIPTVDTVSVSADGKTIDHTPPRDTLYAVQTPQAFTVSLITEAYRLFAEDACAVASDDAGVVRKYLPHVPVQLVEGSRKAHKLTHPEDLLFLEALLQKGAEI